MFCAPSDGYAYYEEWQHLVEKSDKQVKELLEHFGTKCKGEKVCRTFVGLLPLINYMIALVFLCYILS